MAIRKTTKGKNANYRSTKSGAGMTAKGVARYKKAKQMSFTKNLKKEVETGKHGTQKYVLKQGPNKGKTV